MTNPVQVIKDGRLKINKNLDLTHITFVPDFSNGESFTEKK